MPLTGSVQSNFQVAKEELRRGLLREAHLRAQLRQLTGQTSHGKDGSSDAEAKGAEEEEQRNETAAPRAQGEVGNETDRYCFCSGVPQCHLLWTMGVRLWVLFSFGTPALVSFSCLFFSSQELAQAYEAVRVLAEGGHR